MLKDQDKRRYSFPIGGKRDSNGGLSISVSVRLISTLRIVTRK